MTDKFTTNHKYTLFIGLAITLAIMVAGGRDPLGQNFVRTVIPGLALLNSLQWFLLTRKFVWRLLGFCISLAAAAVLLHLNAFSAGFDFANFVTLFFLGMLTQFVTLWFLSAGGRTKNIILAVTLAITFVVLMGRYVNTRHLELPMPSTGRFLFWSPLSAMWIWVGSRSNANWQKQKLAQIVFVCGIAQIGAGLLDVGGANNLPLMAFSAFVVWLAALGLLAHWSKSWGDEDGEIDHKRG